MLIRKNIEYKGSIYNVIADITLKHRKVTINGIDCKHIVKTFGRLKHCFVARTMLNEEDVIVIIYGRYITIEACPKGKFKAYSQQRFAPPIGNDYVFQIISLFVFFPMLGEVYFLLTHYSIGLAFPSMLLFWLCNLTLTYIAYYPGCGKNKRIILWLFGVVLFNLINTAYLLLINQTMN